MANEKITKIQDITDLVTCNNNHTFLSNTVLLVPFSAEYSISDEIVIVDGNFEILEGNCAANTSGFLLACPICKLIHLHGFNKPNKHSIAMPGQDNSILERYLEFDL